MSKAARKPPKSKLGVCPPLPAPAVYRISECAKKLGISDQKVVCLIEDGTLPAIDLALGSRHCYRIPIDAVDEFLKRRRASV
jgi:excisionase family DNA binding protein